MAAFVVEPTEEEKKWIEEHTVSECCARFNTVQVEYAKKKAEEEFMEKLRKFPRSVADVYLN